MTGRPPWRRRGAQPPQGQRYDGPPYIGQEVFVAGRASVVAAITDDGLVQLGPRHPPKPKPEDDSAS